MTKLDKKTTDKGVSGTGVYMKVSHSAGVELQALPGRHRATVRNRICPPPSQGHEVDTKPINNNKNNKINNKTNINDPIVINKFNPSKIKKKQICHWKIGTVNILSASSDLYLHECLRQCTRANLSICCFQEVRRLKKDSIFIPITIDDETTSWNVWWSGHKRKREHGIGIAVKSCKSITIENISQISPRVMFMDCIVMA